MGKGEPNLELPLCVFNLPLGVSNPGSACCLRRFPSFCRLSCWPPLAFQWLMGGCLLGGWVAGWLGQDPTKRCVSPLELAELAEAEEAESCRLVTLAARPWSVSTHRLFPQPARKLAGQLMALGPEWVSCATCHPTPGTLEPPQKPPFRKASSFRGTLAWASVNVQVRCPKRNVPEL